MATLVEKIDELRLRLQLSCNAKCTADVTWSRLVDLPCCEPPCEGKKVAHFYHRLWDRIAEPRVATFSENTGQTPYRIDSIQNAEF